MKYDESRKGIIFGFSGVGQQSAFGKEGTLLLLPNIRSALSKCVACILGGVDTLEYGKLYHLLIFRL
jgi:hypothetical protein